MLQSYPSLSCSFAVATFLFSLPAAAVVSGTRMFRATGLPHPPPIPLRLLHSFPPAADLSISSHSLFLIIFLPLLPQASLLVMRSTPRSLVSLHQLARTPGPAFLSPGNCSNFDPRDTARPVGMWTLHIRAPVSLTRETILAEYVWTLGLILTYSTINYSFVFSLRITFKFF